MQLLGRECLTRRFQDYVHHELWLRVHGAVVHIVRLNIRPHTIGHEMLRLRINHAILFGNQKPRRFRFPCWRRGRLLNALNRDRPLHNGCNVCLLERSLMGNRLAKPTVGNPYKAMRIGN